MYEHFRFISQDNNSHSVDRNFNDTDHQGLTDVDIFVLQFGRRNPDSDESLAIRLILELMWIHRLRTPTPLGLNVFDLKENGFVTSQTHLGRNIMNPYLSLFCICNYMMVLFPAWTLVM